MPIQKYRQLQQVRAANEAFTNKFWKVSSLDTLYADIDDYPGSNMARIFKSVYLEMKKLAESPLVANSSDAKPQLSGIDNLERVIRKIDREMKLAKIRNSLNGSCYHWQYRSLHWSFRNRLGDHGIFP